MDQSNEPLARRLRNAALDRTHTGSERVDDFVLDSDGVVDLRELDRNSGETSIAAPAAVLATIRGQLGGAAEVSELYADPEPERSRWRFSSRSRITVVDAPVETETRAVPAAPAAAPTAHPISRLSLVPLAIDDPSTRSAADRDPVTQEPPGDRNLTTEGSEPKSPGDAHEAEIDLRGEARPTAECPECAGTGRRDLFDRFSQVEYFSCDDCNHMWQRDRS